MKNKLLIVVPIVIFVLLAIILTSVYVFRNVKEGDKQNSKDSIIWSFNGTNWVNTDAKPSNCPTSLTLQTPVDLNKVTNILYPGQVRGGNYKAHGGFRFDTSPNDIEVRIPFDAHLYSASSYIENGQRQYMIDLVSNCGYMVRFDHIAKLAPKVESIFKSEIPDNGENDSRTTMFKTLSFLKAGELVATEVGFKSPKNVSLDFGVYDLNSTNEASKDNVWYSMHRQFAEKDFHGICWLDFLNSDDKKKVYSLPGSGTEGKTSDFCN